MVSHRPQHPATAVRLGTLEPEDWASRTAGFAPTIGEASDDALRGIYAVVLGIEPNEVTAAMALPDDHGLWREGQLRLFLSHSAHHKDFVAEVSRAVGGGWRPRTRGPRHDGD